MKIFLWFGFVFVVTAHSHFRRETTGPPELISLEPASSGDPDITVVIPDETTIIHIDASSPQPPETTNDDIKTTSPPETTSHDLIITSPPKFTCDLLQVASHSVVASVGYFLMVQCVCRSHHVSVGPFTKEFPKEACPEWRGINNVLHKHTQEIHYDGCTVTLVIPRLNSDVPNELVCADVNSEKVQKTWLHVAKSKYEGVCQKPNDCEDGFECVNSKCDCPRDQSIFIPGSKRLCYDERKLYHSCSYSVQCVAKDENSYCHYDSEHDSNSTGLCLCSHGFEAGVDGICAQRVNYVEYVFYGAKRYRILGFVVFGLGMLLLVLGILRIYLIKRRNRSKELLIPPDSVSTSDTEKPKL